MVEEELFQLQKEKGDVILMVAGSKGRLSCLQQRRIQLKVATVTKCI